jgi:hypothetical protein
MAFFKDTVFDEQSGRHERLFVNQQYDWLFVISWNEASGDYALNITPEEALRIARGSGGNWFNVEEALADARKELPALDAAKKA